MHRLIPLLITVTFATLLFLDSYAPQTWTCIEILKILVFFFLMKSVHDFYLV